MKDILRLAGISLVLMIATSILTLLLTSVILGDIVWLSIAMTVLLLVSILYLSFLEGAVEGRKARMFQVSMERQEKERGLAPTEEEKSRFFKSWKGFAGAGIAALPGILLALFMLLCPRTSDLYITMTPVVRIVLSLYMGLFGWAEGLMPYLYLPLALLLPFVIGLGYANGTVFYDRMMKQIEESKRKRRRRKRKKTPDSAK